MPRFAYGARSSTLASPQRNSHDLPPNVRKLRWKRPGMGKRGGLRVIYYVQYQPNEIWMLSLYGKAKSDNIPGYILKELLEVFRNG